MRLARSLRFVAIVWLCSLVLAACDKSAGPADGSRSSPASETGQGAPSAGLPAAMSERQILYVIESMDQAAKRKDVEGLVRHFAKDVRFDIIMPDGRRFRGNKKEYEKLVRSTFAQVSDYQLERSNTRVSIGETEPKANVSLSVRESMKVRGQWVHTVTDYDSIFEVRNGEVRLTEISGEGRIIR